MVRQLIAKRGLLIMPFVYFFDITCNYTLPQSCLLWHLKAVSERPKNLWHLSKITITFINRTGIISYLGTESVTIGDSKTVVFTFFYQKQ